MIKSERIAKRISQEIKVWKKNHAKLVVAIDGYAGSGKTTVADFIAKQNSDILVVHIDDFINHWENRKQMIDSAKDKSKIFEYNWYRYDDMKRLIEEFLNKKIGTIQFQTYDYIKNDFGPEQSFDLSKKILLIDGIFLFHPKHPIIKLMDKKIYLDANFDKADKKRILREKNKLGKSHVPENHPDNWIQYFKIAYKRYIKEYNPAKKADLVFRV
ncbi:MAG: hypothetical protein AAB534_02490 [Patescibacteria group bacterium]